MIQALAEQTCRKKTSFIPSPPFLASRKEAIKTILDTYPSASKTKQIQLSGLLDVLLGPKGFQAQALAAQWFHDRENLMLLQTFWTVLLAAQIGYQQVKIAQGETVAKKMLDEPLHPMHQADLSHFLTTLKRTHKLGGWVSLPSRDSGLEIIEAAYQSCMKDMKEMRTSGKMRTSGDKALMQEALRLSPEDFSVEALQAFAQAQEKRAYLQRVQHHLTQYSEDVDTVITAFGIERPDSTENLRPDEINVCLLLTLEEEKFLTPATFEKQDAQAWMQDPAVEENFNLTFAFMTRGAVLPFGQKPRWEACREALALYSPCDIADEDFRQAIYDYAKREHGMARWALIVEALRKTQQDSNTSFFDEALSIATFSFFEKSALQPIFDHCQSLYSNMAYGPFFVLPHLLFPPSAPEPSPELTQLRFNHERNSISSEAAYKNRPRYYGLIRPGNLALGKEWENEKACLELLTYLKECQSLEALYVNNMICFDFDQQQLTKFFQLLLSTLPRFKQLKTLCLAQIPFNEKVLKALADTLWKRTFPLPLETLNLSGNRLTDQSLITLLTYYPWGNCQTLDLSYNLISDRGAYLLLNRLKNQPSGLRTIHWGEESSSISVHLREAIAQQLEANFSEPPRRFWGWLPMSPFIQPATSKKVLPNISLVPDILEENKLPAEFAVANEIEEDSGRIIEVYKPGHEDASMASASKLPAEVELCKKPTQEDNFSKHQRNLSVITGSQDMPPSVDCTSCYPLQWIPRTFLSHLSYHRTAAKKSNSVVSKLSTTPLVTSSNPMLTLSLEKSVVHSLKPSPTAKKPFTPRAFKRIQNPAWVPDAPTLFISTEREITFRFGKKNGQDYEQHFKDLVKQFIGEDRPDNYRRKYYDALCRDLKSFIGNYRDTSGVYQPKGNVVQNVVRALTAATDGIPGVTQIAQMIQLSVDQLIESDDQSFREQMSKFSYTAQQHLLPLLQRMAFLVTVRYGDRTAFTLTEEKYRAQARTDASIMAIFIGYAHTETHPFLEKTSDSEGCIELTLKKIDKLMQQLFGVSSLMLPMLRTDWIQTQQLLQNGQSINNNKLESLPIPPTVIAYPSEPKRVIDVSFQGTIWSVEEQHFRQMLLNAARDYQENWECFSFFRQKVVQWFFAHGGHHSLQQCQAFEKMARTLPFEQLLAAFVNFFEGEKIKEPTPNARRSSLKDNSVHTEVILWNQTLVTHRRCYNIQYAAYDTREKIAKQKAKTVPYSPGFFYETNLQERQQERQVLVENAKLMQDDLREWGRHSANQQTSRFFAQKRLEGVVPRKDQAASQVVNEATSEDCNKTDNSIVL